MVIVAATKKAVTRSNPSLNWIRKMSSSNYSWLFKLSWQLIQSCWKWARLNHLLTFYSRYIFVHFQNSYLLQLLITEPFYTSLLQILVTVTCHAYIRTVDSHDQKLAIDAASTQMTILSSYLREFNIYFITNIYNYSLSPLRCYFSVITIWSCILIVLK